MCSRRGRRLSRLFVQLGVTRITYKCKTPCFQIINGDIREVVKKYIHTHITYIHYLEREKKLYRCDNINVIYCVRILYEYGLSIPVVSYCTAKLDFFVHKVFFIAYTIIILSYA